MSGVLAVAMAAGVHARAQDDDHTMTNAEVERLRETAYVPADRVAEFIKILDSRVKAVQDLLAKERRPGREEELHDLFEQIGGIADELNDNLDEYGAKHRDLRKALPKLIDATERWETTLRAVPEASTYKVARRLAADSVQDVHDAAAAMQTEQVAYFKAHPEAVKAEQEKVDGEPNREPIDIPR